MDKKIRKFIDFINESKSIVFFGGAGVSTESGIPDFRSKDGLYNQHDVKFDNFKPEYLLSKGCLLKTPEVFYEFYRQKLDVRNIEPNITHKVLAKLEEIGKLTAVVTQNIDGLHQKAGSKNVYEIHGSTLRNYCWRCKKEYPEDHIFTSTESVPKCECGGMIRPNVTLYEELLPDKEVNKALKAIREADMLIIAGTSLTVNPAAGFVQNFQGEHLVVINREPLKIPLSSDHDLFIQASLGDVFSEVEKTISK